MELTDPPATPTRAHQAPPPRASISRERALLLRRRRRGGAVVMEAHNRRALRAPATPLAIRRQATGSSPPRCAGPPSVCSSCCPSLSALSSAAAHPGGRFAWPSGRGPGTLAGGETVELKPEICRTPAIAPRPRPGRGRSTPPSRCRMQCHDTAGPDRRLADPRGVPSASRGGQRPAARSSAPGRCRPSVQCTAPSCWVGMEPPGGRL